MVGGLLERLILDLLPTLSVTVCLSPCTCVINRISSINVIFITTVENNGKGSRVGITLLIVCRIRYPCNGWAMDSLIRALLPERLKISTQIMPKILSQSDLFANIVPTGHFGDP